MHRIRLTAGGDRLEFPGSTSTATVGLTLAKILLNSIVSISTAKFLSADIKDYYYGTPLTAQFEYLRVPIELIPEEIVNQYNLLPLVHDGYVYIEVRKGMPGLKQAGKVAYDRLKAYLSKFGYQPITRTPALWKHELNGIVFTLCVDDFGIKYTNKAQVSHLLDDLC